jgi:hypothetical protein
MHFKFKMDVLLYSKFSPASKQLMLQLQQTPELLESLTITCIDNKLIRKQILSDEKVKINHLPCFIRLNDQTGNFDIYEGQNAFDFFTTLQTQFQQPVSQNYNFTQPQPPISQKYQEPENEIKYENEYENEPIQPPMPQKQIKQNIKQKAQQEESQRHQSELKDMKRKEEFIKNQSKDTNRKAPPTVKNKLSTSLKTVTFTPIEDLELENLQDIDELEDNEEKDGENDENDENDNKDDKELSTSISTYTHIPKNVNSEFSEREVRSKQAEMNASKNTGSILSKAMKMQKERA